MEDFQRYRREQNEDLELLMQYVEVFYISHSDENGIADYEIKQIKEYEVNNSIRQKSLPLRAG